MDLDFCRFMVFFTMPTTVVLSMCISVGGCGWPNSSKIKRMILACLVFKNRDPSLDFAAADDATNFNILTKACIDPFNCMCSPGIGIEPRKNVHPPCYVIFLLLNMTHLNVLVEL